MTFSTIPGNTKHSCSNPSKGTFHLPKLIPCRRLVTVSADLFEPPPLSKCHANIKTDTETFLGTMKTGRVSASLLWMVVSIPSRWRLTQSPPASTPRSATSRACTSTSTWRAPPARVAWADTRKIYR